MDIFITVQPMFIGFFLFLIFLLIVVCVFTFGYKRGNSDGLIVASDKHKRSKKFVRSVLGGLFSENIAPFLPDFPSDLKPSEARFIGKPIDFLIFKGMDEHNITEIVFVEVKSGNSQLTPNEKAVRDAVNAGRVRWHEYRVNKDITNLASEIT